MSAIQHVTTIIGSPKAKNSTSEALLNTFVAPFIEREIDVAAFKAHKVIRRDEEGQHLLDTLQHTDLLIIAFPLYVDALPYVLTRTLELIVSTPPSHSPGLVCIANCGFPEAHHNSLALAICREFAHEAGFEWRGGIAIGEGGVISGKPLQPDGVTHNLYRQLRDGAEQVYSGHAISDSVIEGAAKPLIPYRMYTGMGTMGWLMQSQQLAGDWKAVWKRPYQN
jgi:hypothetical protein